MITLIYWGRKRVARRLSSGRPRWLWSLRSCKSFLNRSFAEIEVVLLLAAAVIIIDTMRCRCSIRSLISLVCLHICIACSHWRYRNPNGGVWWCSLGRWNIHQTEMSLVILLLLFAIGWALSVCVCLVWVIQMFLVVIRYVLVGDIVSSCDWWTQGGTVWCRVSKFKHLCPLHLFLLEYNRFKLIQL